MYPVIRILPLLRGVPTAGGRIPAGNDGFSYSPLTDGHEPPLAYPMDCKRLSGRPRISDMSLEISFSITHASFPYPGFVTGPSILPCSTKCCQVFRWNRKQSLACKISLSGKSKCSARSPSDRTPLLFCSHRTQKDNHLQW